MTMPEDAQVSITSDGGAVTVTGGGELNFMNSREFGDGLRQASKAADSVTVDLRPAVFIDTQIVQDLGMAAVAMLNRGKRLRVVITETAYPLRVLKISGFEQIMDIEVE
jgi:anti-anti-sigma regulatory factor